jgi:CBS domain-containing protein
MTTAAEVLRAKPDKTVHTIEPGASVLDAVRKFAELNIGALLVVDEDKIVGIVSERDYTRKVVLRDRSSRDTPVRDIMTTSVMFVKPEHSTEACLALMTQNRMRHLPVMDEGRLLGLVSIGDLVKDIISEQKFIIEQLEHYISGDRG